MKTFKGTDKNLKCKDFQYELGKEYVIDGKPIKCSDTGYHACENPLDVFKYYPPSNSRYFETESDGEIDKDENSDSKIASSKITLKAELNLLSMIKLGVEYILGHVDVAKSKPKSQVHNVGDQSVATNTGFATNVINTDFGSVAINNGTGSIAANTGDGSQVINVGLRSVAINTGCKSVAINMGPDSVAINSGSVSTTTNTGLYGSATNTGDYGTALCTGSDGTSVVVGKKSLACGWGINNQAKAGLGSWIALSEWKEDDNDERHIINAKFGQIDGKILKADTFYILKDGEFVEA